jgi:N-acetylneuraminate lyase
LTGIDLDLCELLEAAQEIAPTLSGVKYTDPRLSMLRAAAERFGNRVELLYGCDEMLLEGLIAGAKGAVGSTYNFAMPIYRRVLAGFEGGDLDEARRWQDRAASMIEVILRHGGNAAIKATMSLTGVDCGPVRLPQVTVEGQALEALREELDALGFFGWIAR